MSISSDNFYNAEDQYKEFYGISGETDIGDDTKDTFIPTEELNDSHYKDLRILTEANEKLREANDTFTLGAKRTIESNCKLYQENKKLKEGLDKWVESHAKWVKRAALLKEENEKLKEENEKLKEENEKLAETADENPDCCVSCDTRFNLHYTMNHCDAIQKGKYDDYFGSEKDQGDLCPDCINTIC